jgi:hypothetical protein
MLEVSGHLPTHKCGAIVPKQDDKFKIKKKQCFIQDMEYILVMKASTG